MEALSAQADGDARQRLVAEEQQLSARSLLGRHRQAILDEIERLRKVAAYDLCVAETSTTPITQQNSKVTRAAVTERLQGSFREELAELFPRKMKVELREARGRTGFSTTSWP